MRIALKVLLVAALLAGIGLVLAEGVERYREGRYQSVLSEISPLIELPADARAEASADAVRDFIFDHSVPKMDALFWSMQGNREAFARAVLAHAKDRSSEPAHMECSSRSALMEDLLKQRGLKTRRVEVHDTEPPNSHSFLDVLDPATGKWHSVDPLLGIYWRDVNTKERVSLVDRADDLGTVEPCDRSGCGWTGAYKHLLDKIVPLIDLVSVRSDGGPRYTVYTSKVSAKQAEAYCRRVGKNCRDGIRPIATTAAR